MENIDNYTLTLSLEDVGKALQTGWRSKLSPSHNLGEALQTVIKSTLTSALVKKVNICLNSDGVEDFIDPRISEYVRSRKDTMAYLAGLYPAQVVLANTRLSANPKGKADLVVLSLCKEAPDGDWPCWAEMMARIWEISSVRGSAFCGFDEILKIRHFKFTATAHLKPGEYLFKRDIPEWGMNFTFSRAILRLCNLQGMPFTVTKMPGTSFCWLPEIESGGDDKLAVLRWENFRIDSGEKVEMEGHPHIFCTDLLCLEKRFGLRTAHFVKKDGAYQTVVPLTCGEKKIGSLELNFIDDTTEA